MDESYLVVSDLHLGSEDCCNEEFEHFLDWLAACSRNDGRLPVQTQQGDRRLTPPTTFILLGDMVELWVPREHERSSVLCDSTSIFSKLIDLNCKKVYVLGNHDADLFEHECEKDVRPNDSFQTLMEWVCSNDSSFELVQRHYPNCPDDPLKQRVRLGEKDYLFLHGQQFDRDFNTSRGLVRFVPFMAGLASAFDFFPAGGIFLALSVFFLWLFAAAARGILAIDPLWFIVLFMLAAYPGLSWLIVRVFTPTWELKKTLSAVIALAGQSQEDVLSTPWDVNKNLNNFKHELYETKKQQDRPKYKNINTIISEKYYRPDKDASKPDVIIFGHTHVPEICKAMPIVDDNGQPVMRQFVNSGMWLRPSKRSEFGQESKNRVPQCDEEGNDSESNKYSLHNTFVYIDRDGPLLFRWCDKERTAKEIPAADCIQTQ
jgi:UDP-2,3-diacylglucosamine pyrophosphatase LpxH